MRCHKSSAILVVTTLAVSSLVLGWSVASRLLAGPVDAAASTAIDSATAENLPPRLASSGAKASLFYPVMKSRGPMPGGKLVAKPLYRTADSNDR